jgi:hypothetical protein
MNQTITFTSVALIILDAFLIWGCWAIDKHMMSQPVPIENRPKR